MKRAVAMALAMLAGSAFAQVAEPPPRVDPKTHPQLAAMRSWLQSGVPEARYCALSGGLFIEAVDLYRGTKSEVATVDAMMRVHGDKVSGAERERLRSMINGVVLLASGLARFDRDSAAVAFTQICINRAQRPGQPTEPAVMKAQLDAAYACEQRLAAGSLDRKECVAVALRLPK
jgi:hypothetical protein